MTSHNQASCQMLPFSCQINVYVMFMLLSTNKSQVVVFSILTYQFHFLNYEQFVLQSEKPFEAHSFSNKICKSTSTGDPK